MTDAPKREIAYQTYINEVTLNGNTRLTNIILYNVGDRAEQHIATQIDLAFQAGWLARAKADPYFQAKAAGRALPSTSSQCEGQRPAVNPLDDPRVKALVEALKEAERMLKHYGSRDAGGMAQIKAALEAIASPSISALEEDK